MANNFTTGKPSRQLFWFAVPILLGNVFQQFYNIVDSAVVGRLIGNDALGAVGASYPVIFAIISLISGIAGGFTIVVSQYFGARQYDNVKATITTMYFFIFFFSALASILALIFSKEIFLLLDLPIELLDLATRYINIYMSGIILFFGYAATTAILRGLGDSKTPLYFLIFSTLLNISLDLLFVYVLGYGVEGVAYATIIAQGIAFIAISIYVHHKNVHLRINFSSLKFDFDIFKKAIRIGLPSGIQMVAVSVGMVIISRLVNGFGTEVIAAYSVAMRIDSLAVMPAMAYSQAVASFTGQNMGAGKFSRVMSGYKTSLSQSLIICVIMTAVIVIFGENLMGIFTEDPEIIRIGKEYLVIVSSFYALFVILFNSNGVLRGAGDTLIPMFVTIVALWIVRIPVAYYLAGFMGETGVWWSVPAGWAVGATFSTLYFFSGKWRTKGVVKHFPKEEMLEE
ncbi:putative MATE family efflux protein [Balneicella halophila]|uniref:Multidrug-efflux transporter n=1 Tax=Balneicella halophila TaxID=1537566 RepID=A0A7L4USX5_BALHA|nr:MATE family efflux transporter [Balneicella halophila]PVX52124.1 putative MATE family efflux protein [Balneicella halophila]